MLSDTAVLHMVTTGPAVTTAHYDCADVRCIGVPLPGAEVKLVPAEDGYEIRARGPMVTPGYHDRADLTAEAFDDEGFYQAGDAVAFADPGDPNAGLLFRGGTAEDFKLSTGTFVRVGAVRAALLSAATPATPNTGAGLAKPARRCAGLAKPARRCAGPAKFSRSTAALSLAEGLRL